jgi:flavoprotein
MLKKIVILNSVILLSLTFNGCTRKEIVTVDKIKYICNKQSIYEQPKLNIYIAKEDLENAKAYKQINDFAYENYQNQVLENNKLCDEFLEK